MITEDQKEVLAYKIDAEGFDYCFNGYSDWKEVKDEEFHRLRESYVKISREFQNYIDALLESE